MKKIEFPPMPIMSREQAKSAGEKYYFTGEQCKHGHIGPRYTKWGTCIPCGYVSYDARTDRRRETAKQYKKERPDQMMFWRVKGRAKKLGIEFSLTVEDMAVPERCPCCNQRMEVRPSEGRKCGPSFVSPSLDRLNPDGGYVRGNVAVICWRCNSLKKDATIEELETVLNWMKSLKKSAEIKQFKIVS